MHLLRPGIGPQRCVQAQSWAMPKVFSVAKLLKQLIWTRMFSDELSDNREAAGEFTILRDFIVQHRVKPRDHGVSRLNVRVRELKGAFD